MQVFLIVLLFVYYVKGLAIAVNDWLF
jgi:hypothetical protein